MPLAKALVLSENDIFPIFSFKSADGKVAARDRLEMFDKCIVYGSAADRTDNWDSLRGYLLRNNQSKPRGNLGHQTDKHWATFLNDPPFSNKASGFRNGLREDAAYHEIVALGRIISLHSTADPKNLDA